MGAKEALVREDESILMQLSLAQAPGRSCHLVDDRLSQVRQSVRCRSVAALSYNASYGLRHAVANLLIARHIGRRYDPEPAPRPALLFPLFSLLGNSAVSYRPDDHCPRLPR